MTQCHSHMWLPRGQDGSPRPICHLLPWLGVICVPLDRSPTHAPRPGPPPPLGTVQRVSWGRDKVSGSSGELEELAALIWDPGAPHCADLPNIQPWALLSPGTPASELPPAGPPLDLVLISHRRFLSLSPVLTSRKRFQPESREQSTKPL